MFFRFSRFPPKLADDVIIQYTINIHHRQVLVNTEGGCTRYIEFLFTHHCINHPKDLYIPSPSFHPISSYYSYIYIVLFALIVIFKRKASTLLTNHVRIPNNPLYLLIYNPLLYIVCFPLFFIKLLFLFNNAIIISRAQSRRKI